MTIRIAVDCMGGDHGLSVTVPAALGFLGQIDDVRLLLVGPKEAIEQALAKSRRADAMRIEVRHASEVVAMDDPPATALRGKRDSSMRVAIPGNMCRRCFTMKWRTST